MSEARFADISSYNPTSNAYFDALKNAGASGVVVKLTEGTSYFSPNASAQCSQAKSHNMKLSVYHFWRGNATAEANFFLSKIKQLGLPTSTPVVCDYEASPSSASSINAFFSVLENAGYKNISIYTMSSWVKAGRLSGVKGYQWIASYGVAKCPVPCDAWQYSDKTIIMGNTTDFSIDYKGLFTDPNAGGGSSASNQQREEDNKKAQADKTNKEDCYSFINMLNSNIYDKWLY